MNELVDDLDMSVFPGFLRSWFIIDEPRTFMWSSEILFKLGDLLNKKYPDGKMCRLWGVGRVEVSFWFWATVCVCVPRCGVWYVCVCLDVV
jgi:hypothetical protein